MGVVPCAIHDMFVAFYATGCVGAFCSFIFAFVALLLNSSTQYHHASPILYLHLNLMLFSSYSSLSVL